MRRNPPKELWTCRDWSDGEPTKLLRREVVEDECPKCPDKPTCKGPVKYGCTETR